MAALIPDENVSKENVKKRILHQAMILNYWSHDESR